MNANELADEFETLLKECEEHPWGNFEILYHLTATMLRQQQSEIEELKTIRGKSVLVPSGKLQSMQSEIEALKKQIPDWENINKPNPFIGWEKSLVAVDSNPNSGLGGIALKKAREK